MLWGAEASKLRVTPKVLARTAGLAPIPGNTRRTHRGASSRVSARAVPLSLFSGGALTRSRAGADSLEQARSCGEVPQRTFPQEARTHIPVLGLSRCPASLSSPSVTNAPLSTLLSKCQLQTWCVCVCAKLKNTLDFYQKMFYVIPFSRQMSNELMAMLASLWWIFLCSLGHDSPCSFD